MARQCHRRLPRPDYAALLGRLQLGYSSAVARLYAHAYRERSNASNGGGRPLLGEARVLHARRYAHLRATAALAATRPILCVRV
jgi:hypothetical protein